MNDSELATLVWQGDERAFHQLFERYARLLCEVAMSYVRVRDVAQEITQDVFCRVWEQRERLNVPENMRAYLYVAVRRRALDHIRHQRVVQQVTDMPFEGNEYPGLGEPEMLIDDQLLEQERHQLLLRAIESLPARQRRLFELRWYHHLTYAEIGEVLKITPKGVEALRARAIESLKKKLRGVLGD